MNDTHLETIRSLEDEFGCMFNVPRDNPELLKLHNEIGFNSNPWGGHQSFSIPRVAVGSFKGEVVKQRVKDMGVSYANLGAEIGLSRSTIAHKMNSNIWVTYKQLYDILEYTDLALIDVVDEKTYNEIMCKEEEAIIAEVKEEFNGLEEE